MLVYNIILHLTNGEDVSFKISSEKANEFLIFRKEWLSSKVIECYMNDDVRPLHVNYLIEVIKPMEWYSYDKYNNDTIKNVSVEYNYV